MVLQAPYPWMGGKRDVVGEVWSRLGRPRHYIEPFFGSGIMLLAAPAIASLEVVNDWNGFLANFWRATKHQPAQVAHHADYPVSHIDQGARHGWLLEQRTALAESLADPNWPGDAQVAGWWLWGQCIWIGSGWCNWDAPDGAADRPENGQIPSISSPGSSGIHASGKRPSLADAGMGIHAIGARPSLTNAGMGIHASGKRPALTDAGDMPQMLTSAGRTAWVWLHRLAARLERVRIIHGDWQRCLNHHYGSESTAIFLDPPYKGREHLYMTPGADEASKVVANECEAWCKEHPHLRIALCGLVGEYELPGWDIWRWKRTRQVFCSNTTRDQEAIWFSPSCLTGTHQLGLW